MDRLVCGDVGYGKTEVAVRAAFKAVMDGKQVAVLVPTTVLAQQHYNTFRERLAGFPVRVEMLSRFRSDRDQRQVAADAATGSVDIVIGTHRLLQKDVAFKNLGLVIIDEEQRFGVAHKERLKQMRTEVDVLTLTATPIPRTLHMSLTGIRDMSTIETPPEERLPIKTYVDRVRRPPRPRGDPARAGARRPGLLRPQPRPQHRADRRAAPRHRARGGDPHRPRPDARGPAREGDARLRRRRRRARLHDDHRVRPRHPERQHDHHQQRRQVRPGAALPAARAASGAARRAPTPTCSTRSTTR